MKWLRKNTINIFLIYLNIFFIIGLIKGAYEIVDFNNYYILLLITAGIIIYFILYAFFLLTNQRLGGILIILVLLLGLSLIYRNVINSFIRLNIVESINEINNAIYEGGEIGFALFKGIFLVTIPIASILCLWLAHRGILDFLIFAVLSIMMFLWLLDYKRIIEENLVQFSLLAIVTYAINNHNIFMKNLESKRIRHSFRPIRIGLPVLLTACIITYLVQFMPKDIEGRYTRVITNRFNNIFLQNNASGGKENNLKTIKNNIFSISQSGYSNSESKLGGPITINNDTVFWVDSRDSYYLKGSTKEIYTGEHWSSDIYSFSEINKFDGSEIRKIRNKAEGFETLTIYPKNNKQSAIFLPNYPQRIDSNEEGLHVNEENYTAAFISSSDKPYGVIFYPERSFADRVKGYQGPSFSISDAYMNKSEYLQLPDSITMRTVELVEQITKGSKNNYEKAARLVNYISTNYEYTLDANEVPEGWDFVDYYLFEEQKGYCVYSSSALAIMLRIAGIPSRYVEGFRMSQSKADNANVYEVTNADAHAWVEAYLEDGEDYYWITLDASTTPRQAGIDFNVPGDQGEGDKDKDEEDLEDVPSKPIEPGEENKDPQKDNDIDNGSNKEGKINFHWSYYVIFVLLFLIGGKLLYNRFTYSKIIRAGSLIPLYNYSIKRLKTLGYKREAWETDKDFASRIEEDNIRAAITRLVELVYKESFGGIKEDVEVKELYLDIENFIKASTDSKTKYYIKRFLRL